MDVVVVGSFLIYGKLICTVGCAENTVCKTVRQIEGRKSPYLCGLLYNIRCIAAVEAEELHSVHIVVKTDHICAYLICNECFIAACFKLHALYIIEFCKLCIV